MASSLFIAARFSSDLKPFVGLRQIPPEKHTPLSKSLPTPQIHRRFRISASKSRPKLSGRNLRVAVVGGGPAGGAAAETLAKGGIETFLIERKLDNCKPCGGAIPLCMVGEFDLPLDIIDRRVTKMKMISPSNVAVDIGQTLKPNEYIGMVRREVLDAYLRDRASASGASVINGLFLRMDLPQDPTAPYVLHYNSYDGKTGGVGEKLTLEVDAVIGADGANSRVAKNIGAGEYDYAIAFQERIKIPDEKMVYYENLAEMYVGDDVSPDFYGWVFPKCDHVAVGTGTVTHKGEIKKFQLATRLRAKEKISGGKIIRVEAHPIPEHPRPRRLAGRVALVGDAAGYVTKCSGEGIYFAAKSGRMCAEAIVEGSEKGKRMVEEDDLRKYLEIWDKTYWPTYKVLDVLQKVFYRSNPAREAFVEMCADEYVQKMTFDSYLYKRVVPGNPLDDLKLAVNTIGSLVRANALRREMDKINI
ncbi:geranylgeranyl diphosphate reductase, chloroplastic [Magnolia sinica]|uniref:geranylgeranyl diphosphate reductase, chloroplastic n=1 Tax=Magnolia sinica TaxID=86752 RepID=UPI0026581869|nr:geranylgeranyl diphosphate reductase, chloroplastic [Magnolia sinica]